MRNTTDRKIALLERKISHLNNDLFKLILKDYHKFVPTLDNNLHIEYLEQIYKDKLHELRNLQRGKTKQLDIEEEINLMKSRN